MSSNSLAPALAWAPRRWVRLLLWCGGAANTKLYRPSTPPGHDAVAYGPSSVIAAQGWKERMPASLQNLDACDGVRPAYASEARLTTRPGRGPWGRCRPQQ